MHYCGYIITNKIPTKEEIEDILWTYSEYNDENNMEFSWDWFKIGGRYAGKFKIHFDPEENEDNYYMFKNRNFKYFIINKLAEIKEKFSKNGYFDELDFLLNMGLREKILFVDGAFYKDIYDFDITNNYFVIDSEQKLYVRESYQNDKFVTDCDYDNKVKLIDVKDKFITIVDIHN